MASIAEASSLFEIDMELDGLLEEIQRAGRVRGCKPRKTWWPDSNNSAKHTARRSTGSAASCA